MSLVGGHLHVVLAMVSNEEDGPDSGFEPRSLRRMIEELCHEVRVTRRRVTFFFVYLGNAGPDWRKSDRDRGDSFIGEGIEIAATHFYELSDRAGNVMEGGQGLALHLGGVGTLTGMSEVVGLLSPLVFVFLVPPLVLLVLPAKATPGIDSLERAYSPTREEWVIYLQASSGYGAILSTDHLFCLLLLYAPALVLQLAPTAHVHFLIYKYTHTYWNIFVGTRVPCRLLNRSQLFSIPLPSYVYYIRTECHHKHRANSQLLIARSVNSVVF